MQAGSKRKLLAAGLFVLILVALQSAVAALEFDRQQILAGQVWRLWTGHLVHTHSSHLALNAVAAIALYIIIFTRLNTLELLSSAVVFACLISLSLLYWHPDLDWYNGLSGLLHGLASYYLLRLACTENKKYALGLLAVWLKVLFELYQGQLGYQQDLAGMTVITQAHYIGAWIGSCAAACYSAVAMLRQRLS